MQCRYNASKNTFAIYINIIYVLYDVLCITYIYIYIYTYIYIYIYVYILYIL